MSAGFRVKITFAVVIHGKTQDHSGGGSKRNRGNEAGETEQVAESQKREN